MTEDLIGWRKALEQVGKAKFGRHWISKLNEREEYVLKATASIGPPFLSDSAKVEKKADWMAYQHGAVHNWFRRHGFLRDQNPLRSRFEYFFDRAGLPFGGGMGIDGFHFTEAYQRVGEAMFKGDWISSLTDSELHIHERGSSEPEEFVSVNMKAREMNLQHERVLRWLNDNYFFNETAGEDVGAKFERALAEEFPSYKVEGSDPILEVVQRRKVPEGPAHLGRKRKAAPKGDAVAKALMELRIHIDQQNKSYKEITLVVEEKIGTGFGANFEARVKAVTRELRRLKASEGR